MASRVKKLIGFDTEVSALSPEAGQILTLTMAAVDAGTGEEIERLEISVGYRGDVIPQPGAVAVNRINPLRHRGVAEASAATQVAEFIARHGGADSPFLGHNPEFDKHYLRNLLVRNGIDSSIVSLRSVDTIMETGRKIFQGNFPAEKLQRKNSWTDRPSLNQTSVAQALGISVDAAKAHTSSHDVDVNLEIWRSLGMPLGDEKQDFNSPYETEKKLAGKIVRTREWDGRSGQVVERSYYVIGSGVREEEDTFGKVKYAGTAMISLDSVDDIMAAVFAAERLESAVAGSHRGTSGEASQASGAEGGQATSAPALASASANKADKEELRQLVARLAVERKFTSPPSFAAAVEDPSDEKLEKLLLLSPYVLQSVDAERRRDREKLYTTVLSAASGVQFDLKDPNNKIGLLQLGDQHLVPRLAAEIADMTDNERSRHISAIANHMQPPRGVNWAHSLLIMTERYGYRNGLSGYEQARLRDIRRQMPQTVEPVVAIRRRDDCEGALRDAMDEKGVGLIEMTCSGRDVFIKLYSPEGDYIDRRRLDCRENRLGQLAYPLAQDLAQALSELTGAPVEACHKTRSGFSAFYDKGSYEVAKKSFAEAIEKAKKEGTNPEGLKALEECLSDFGSSYDDFIAASAPKLEGLGSSDRSPSEGSGGEGNEQSEQSEHGEQSEHCEIEDENENEDKDKNEGESGGEDTAETSGQKRSLENLRHYMEEAEALRRAEVKRVRDGYDSLSAFSLPAGADSRFIMAANLKSTRAELVKDLDAAVLSLDLNLHTTEGEASLGAAYAGEAEQRAAGEAAGESTKTKKKAAATTTGSDDPALVARCKVCNREVKGKNAVAGMGPTCGRKLAEWLERPEIAASDISRRKFKRLSDLKDDAPVYPIMAVRHIKSGQTFAADIITKERDGRYLVINLTEIAREKSFGRPKGQLKDCFRVYLDPENFEIANIFGSDLNIYK